jgi:hypothetical protein
MPCIFYNKIDNYQAFNIVMKSPVSKIGMPTILVLGWELIEGKLM